MFKNFKSLIQDKKECYICHTTENLDVHHIMNGAFKKASEKYFGTIYVCKYHHTLGGKNCIHDNPSMKTKIKQEYQKAFELLYGHDLWMKEFKKNYL